MKIVYCGYVSQSAEQNDLRLPELVTNWTSDNTARENRQNILHYCRNKLSNSVVPDTKNHSKKHPLEVAKNMWKRIPHLTQRHQTPRKGYTTIHKEK